MAWLWLAGGVLAVVLVTALLGRRAAGAAGHAAEPARDDDARAPASRELAAAGRYAEALAARYAELLEQLERRGALRRRAGSTGRAYQRQLRAPLDAAFGELLRALYPARFGGVRADAALWQRWERAAAELEARA